MVVLVRNGWWVAPSSVTRKFAGRVVCDSRRAGRRQRLLLWETRP